MTATARLFAHIFACCATLLASSVLAGGVEEATKAKSTAVSLEKPIESEIARYCGNVAPTAAEARIAFQMKHLLELESQITRQLSELDVKQEDARRWVTKREAMMKSASDDVVAIYAKMPAEAAAARIAALDDNVAAALLSKLTAKVASSILGEMETVKAAKLTSLMTGVTPDDRKS